MIVPFSVFLKWQQDWETRELANLGVLWGNAALHGGLLKDAGSCGAVGMVMLPALACCNLRMSLWNLLIPSQIF